MFSNTQKVIGISKDIIKTNADNFNQTHNQQQYMR